MALNTVLNRKQLASQVRVAHPAINFALRTGILKADYVDVTGKPYFLETNLPQIRQILTGETSSDTPCQN